MPRITVSDLTNPRSLSEEELKHILGGAVANVARPSIVTGAGPGGGPHVKKLMRGDGSGRIMEEEGIWYYF